MAGQLNGGGVGAGGDIEQSDVLKILTALLDNLGRRRSNVTRYRLFNVRAYADERLQNPRKPLTARGTPFYLSLSRMSGRRSQALNKRGRSRD